MENDKMTIRTNNVPRPVINGWQLTQDERAEFDYINWSDVEEGKANAEFFRYKGELYDLQEFDWVGELRNTHFKGWDSYQSDSFFSGLLVRYVPDSDYEEIVVGMYYS